MAPRAGSSSELDGPAFGKMRRDHEAMPWIIMDHIVGRRIKDSNVMNPRRKRKLMEKNGCLLLELEVSDKE